MCRVMNLGFCPVLSQMDEPYKTLTPRKLAYFFDIFSSAVHWTMHLEQTFIFDPVPNNVLEVPLHCYSTGRPIDGSKPLK